MKLSLFPSLAAVAIGALAFLPTTARAHHGQDFLVVQGYEVPGSLGAVLFGDFEWERTNGDDEYGFEPGLLIGLLPQTALEIQTSFRNEPDGGWKYQSVTPSLIVQLTPADSKCPFRVALSAGYEFAEEAGHAHEHEHEHEAEHGHADEHEHEAETTHGGHRHGTDGFEGRVIMEYQSGDWLIGTNIIADTDEDGSAGFGYSAGVRYRVCEGFATGVEAEGDFESNGAHELIAGFYFEPTHSAVIKLGAGFGLNEHSPDFALRTGLVWRF